MLQPLMKTQVDPMVTVKTDNILEFLEPVFRTGIDDIDNQHGRLIDLLRDLEHAIHSRCSKAIIEEFLAEFIDVAIHHFEDEERLMARVGYFGLDEHRQEHEWLLISLKRFSEEVDKDSPPFLEVLDFLWEWTIVHMVESDTAYVPFLEK